MLFLFPFWRATLWRRSGICRRVVLGSVIARAVVWLRVYMHMYIHGVCARACVHREVSTHVHTKHSGMPKILPTDSKAALGTFYCFRKVSERAELSSLQQHSMPSCRGTPQRYKITRPRILYLPIDLTPYLTRRLLNFIYWLTLPKLIFSPFHPSKKKNQPGWFFVSSCQQSRKYFAFNSVQKIKRWERKNR